MNIPIEIINRYDNILKSLGYKVEEKSNPGTSGEHLRWMLGKLNEHENPFKAHRWLGFIQGVMIREGWVTVTSERNFTRGKFING